MREAVLIALGLLGIYIEFLRPGWAIPGAAGLVLVTLGIAGLFQGTPDWSTILIIDGPVLLLSIPLLTIALRARRNKTRMS
jgi:membrane-bound ClpP family serine protease